MSADDWFDAIDGEQKAILQNLRVMILSSGEGIVEEIKWSRPVYSNDQGMFCYLHSTKTHATLGFHQGTSLTDPKRLLEGTGKDMRHVKIQSPDDFPKEDLRDLVHDAMRKA